VELPSNLARYGVNGIYYDSLSGLCWFGYGTVAASEHTSYLAKSRMKVASKFLTHGDMPEPPELLNDLPTVTTPPCSRRCSPRLGRHLTGRSALFSATYRMMSMR